MVGSDAAIPWTRWLQALATAPLAALALGGAAAPPDPEAIYESRCQMCHGLGVLAPTPEQLGRLTVEEIEAALWHGTMQEHANGLSRAERLYLARWLSRRAGGAFHREPGVRSCKPVEGAREPAGRDWPGWSNDNRFQRHLPDPAFRVEEVAGLRLRWAHPFPLHAAFSGAGNAVAVQDGRLFTGNLNHFVYALDARSGCALWSFRAEGRVRSNMATDGELVVFGDLMANAYALDADSGRLLWRTRVDWSPGARITGNVTLHGGRVYVPVSSLEEVLAMKLDTPCCLTRGSVVALDAATGEIQWKTYTIDQQAEYLGENEMGIARYGPSGVPVWSGISVDEKRGVVYAGTGNQFTEPRVEVSDAVVALDMDSGAKRWVRSLAPAHMGAQDIYTLACEAWWDPERKNCSPENPEGEGDRDIGAPPMLLTRSDGKDVVVAGSKDGMVYALDPDASGALLWQRRVGRGGEVGGIEFGLAADERYVFAPVVDMDADMSSDGSLTAIDLVTGEAAWRVEDIEPRCAGKPQPPCGNAVLTPPTVAGDVVLAGLIDGTLRAWHAETGEALAVWDTARSYQGVNGLSGSGGSLGNGGPVVVGRTIYITSGFNMLNIGMPGNVLLALEIPARAGAAAD